LRSRLGSTIGTGEPSGGPGHSPRGVQGGRGGAGMRRLRGIGVAVLVIGTLAAAAGAQPPAIVPGQSLGDFRLGQDVTPLLDQLGPLHSQDDLPGDALTGYYWPLRHIGAIAEKTTHKIVALVVSLDDTYRTDKGIMAGAEMDAVRAAYGREGGVEDHPAHQGRTLSPGAPPVAPGPSLPAHPEFNPPRSA